MHVHRAVIHRVSFLACGVVLLAAGLDAQGRAIVARGEVVEAGTDVPVAGAVVQVLPSGAATAVPRASVKAGIAGEFTVSSSDTVGILVAQAPGFVPTRLRWPPRDAGRDLRITLDRPTSLRVDVSGANGEPVNAMLTLALRRPGNPTVNSARAPNGDVELANLPPAPGVIIVKADGFAPEARDIDLRPLPAVNWQLFRLRRAAVVDGQVLDSFGAVVTGASVSVVYPRSLHFSRFLETLIGGKFRTGSDGVFRLNGLVPGVPIEVTAALGTRRSKPVQLRLTEGQVLAPLVLRLPG